MASESYEIQDMPTDSCEIQDKPTDVYDNIQYIASDYVQGATMYWIEKRYHMEFKRSLDYGSLGVKDFKELIYKMRDNGRLLVYVKPETKETYVMCARFAESSRKFLRNDVERLLKSHGDVPFSCFEAMYKEVFKHKVNYHLYNLTSLEHLCEALNLVVLEEAGQKVIKPCNVYNLRKRKK